MNETMNKLHKVELEIAKEFKRICEKNNIKYYMIAGTLLGAVRHKGFIPWDDDMDFGMLRQDYEKFIECCKKDLSNEFFLQTWNTDPHYPFSYAKIRLKETLFVEELSKNSKMKNGIFIDIFPFDNVPLKINQIKKQNRKYYFYKRILWMKKKCGTTLIKEKPIKFIFLWCVSKMFNYKFLKNKFDKTQKKYNAVSAEKVVADGSYGYYKESILLEFFTSQTILQFEGEDFTTFSKYDEYLKYFYGEYMQLPPEEKRKGHLPQIIDFGKY